MKPIPSAVAYEIRTLTLKQLRREADRLRLIGAHALALKVGALANEIEAYIENPRKVA